LSTTKFVMRLELRSAVAMSSGLTAITASGQPYMSNTGQLESQSATGDLTCSLAKIRAATWICTQYWNFVISDFPIASSVSSLACVWRSQGGRNL
jgi:hypothetical protein